MKDVYGAITRGMLTPELFEIGVVVSDVLTETRNRDGTIRKPYQEITLYQKDNEHCYVSVSIPVMGGKDPWVVSEDNVFDVLEYLIYNFGQRDDAGVRRNNIHLFFDDALCRAVTLKRGVGCREFLFQGREENFPHGFTIVVPGAGIDQSKRRYDVPHVLSRRPDFFKETGPWSVGTNTHGLVLTIYKDGEPAVGEQNCFIYHIPRTTAVTAKDIAFDQLTAKRNFRPKPEDFTTPEKTFDNTLIKKVYSESFWYLISRDRKLVLGLTKSPILDAVTFAYSAINQLEEAIAREYRNRFILKLENLSDLQDQALFYNVVMIIEEVLELKNKSI